MIVTFVMNAHDYRYGVEGESYRHDLRREEWDERRNLPETTIHHDGVRGSHDIHQGQGKQPQSELDGRGAMEKKERLQATERRRQRTRTIRYPPRSDGVKRPSPHHGLRGCQRPW
jgi:hypothetical protein